MYSVIHKRVFTPFWNISAQIIEAISHSSYSVIVYWFAKLLKLCLIFQNLAPAPCVFKYATYKVEWYHQILCKYKIRDRDKNSNICWDISLHHMLRSSFWLPHWQIFQIQQLCMHTSCTVILPCIGGANLLFIDEMKGIYFASFYFHIFDSTREICENKT